MKPPVRKRMFMIFSVKLGSQGLVRALWAAPLTDFKSRIWLFENLILGKIIGVVEFQKRKAAAKCLAPDVTITCPDDCFGCDPTSMAAQVTNQNDGNPFPIVAQCVNTKNKKRANWNIFCDTNGNGLHDEDEQSQAVIGKKNCVGEVLPTSMWTLNCGDGNQSSACGIDFANVQSQITNINQGNQYPILVECTKYQNAKIWFHLSDWRLRND